MDTSGKNGLEQLYITFSPLLYKYALSLTHDRYSAEDAVQGAFYAAIQKNVLSTHPNPAGWLFVATRYEALNSLKSPECPADTQTFPPSSSGFDLAELRLTLSGILTAAEYRIFELYFFDGRNEGEISGCLHISKSALYARIHRIKQKIRALYALLPFALFTRLL